MKKNTKKAALIVSAVSALSMLTAIIPAGMSATAANKYKINVNAVKNTDFSIDEYDPAYDFGNRNGYGADNKNDYYDFLVVETEINDLLAAENYPERKLDCTAVTLSSDAQANNITPKMLDITNDGHLSPEDYCVYLRAISKDYSVDFNEGDTVAEIKKYIGNDVEELVVPGSIYDDDYAVILPVENIKGNAFSSCSSLSTVYINNYRHANWKNVFGNPMNPEHKILASSYINIKPYAFTGCDNLENVYLPENIVMSDDYGNPTTNGFEGTPFDKNINNHYVLNGIEYFVDSDTESQKIFAARAYTHAYDQGTSLAFIPGTTSINDYFYKTLNASVRNDITNITLPRSFKFIGINAFSNFEGLTTVNGSEYAEQSDEMKNEIKRYINAFNCTPFMAVETQRKLDEVIAEINNQGINENSPTEVKELAAAKAVIKHVAYTSYNSGRGFSLYPDSLYDSIDFHRLNYASEHAGLNTGYTECGGIAATYSFILDMLNVKNYRVGGNAHSFNMVNLNGTWRASDLAGMCGHADNVIASDHSLDRETVLNNYLNSLTNDSINSNTMRFDANIYGEPSFKFFEASKDKQFTDADNEFYFVLDDTDLSKLYVYRYNGEDGATCDQTELASRIQKLNDNTITTISLKRGLQQIGNHVYYISDNSDIMPKVEGYKTYEELEKEGYKFDGWSRTLQR